MWSWARYPLVSPVWTSRLRLSSRPGLRRDDRVAEAGDEDVRHDRREPRPGAEEDPVGLADRGQGLVGAARVRRQQAYALHPPPGRGDPVLAPDDGDGLGVCGVVADDLGLDLERDAGHRQDPAAGVEQPADEVQAVDGVAEQVPEGHDEEVAEGVAGQRPLALEPVLEHVPPGVAPLGVVAERRERHPQIPGRQDRELLAQPSRRPAVVGDRDDGGDPVGEQLQRGEGRRQAVAPAEGDDLGVARIPAGLEWSWRGSLPPEVAVDEEGVDGVGAQPLGQLLGDGDRPVLATRAAERRA